MHLRDLRVKSANTRSIGHEQLANDDRLICVGRLLKVSAKRGSRLVANVVIDG